MLSLASKHSRTLLTDGFVKSLHKLVEKPVVSLAVSSPQRFASQVQRRTPFDWTATPKPRNAANLVPLTPPGGPGPSSYQDLNPDEAHAIRKAVDGNASRLLECIWAYVKGKDAKHAFKLYDRYIEERNSIESSPPEPLQPKADPNSPLAFDLDKSDEPALPSSAPSSSYISHARVVLAVLTAHAMEGSLDGAIQAFAAARVRWPQSLVAQFLQKTDANNRDKIAAFFQDVKIVHWLSRPSAFAKHIKSLASTRSLPAIWELYTSVYRGVTAPTPFITPSPANDTHPALSIPIPVTEIVWGSFLAAFLRCDRPDLSAQLWSALHQFKVAPGTGLWTTYLDGFDHLRVSAPALQLWKEMTTRRVKPDALTYRAIISVCLRDGQQAIGMDKFEEFRGKEKEAGWSETHRKSVYNTVLDGLLLHQALPEARAILEDMKAHGPPPDVVTYNSLLGYFHRHRDFTGIANTITEMDDRKIQGDVYTFSILLSALLKAGKEDATDIVFQCMKEQGVQANVAIYTTLIDNQLQGQTEANLVAVLNLLDRMVLERTVLPNDVTYTSILTNIHRGDWLPLEKITMYQQAVLLRMKEQRIQLNLPGYHTILKACFEVPHEGNVKHALMYYQEIKQRGIPLVQTTWYILLAGLVQNEEWGLARRVVDDMKLSRIMPSTTLAKLVSKVMQRTSGYSR